MWPRNVYTGFALLVLSTIMILLTSTTRPQNRKNWRVFGYNSSGNSSAILDIVTHAPEVMMRTPTLGNLARMKAPFLPLSEETFFRVQTEQQKRKQQIGSVCKKLNQPEHLTQLKNSKQILVDEKHKVLFCYTPKVGCTSWKVRLVLGLNHSLNLDKLTSHPSPVDSNYGLVKLGLRFLHSFSQKQIQHILDTYYKVMFTRHPMERFLSAYRSKWEKRSDNAFESNSFYRMYHKYLLKVLHKNTDSHQKQNTSSQVSLEDFMRLVLIESKKPHLMEPHWAQLHQMCHPCDVHYDFVGKFDTLRDDISFVLRHIYKSPDEYFFPSVPKPRSTLDKMKRYFGKEEDKLIQELERVYKLDFEMFGYEKNSLTNMTKS